MNSLTMALNTHLLASSEVTKLSSLRRFTSLFTQGQSADALYFIAEGLVKLTRTNGAGDRIILAIVGSEDLIGEEVMSAERTVYQADAEVLSAATLYRIPRECIQKEMTSNGALSATLIDFLLKRQSLLSQKVELLCLHDVAFRLLHYLGQLAALIGPGSTGSGYQLPVTQAELADLIGATRETTSTTLNQLERKGLVKLSRRLLTIPSTELLKMAAGGHGLHVAAETA